jgi:photosystem II stability/assembly factor-like uncharacterized protein
MKSRDTRNRSRSPHALPFAIVLSLLLLFLVPCRSAFAQSQAGGTVPGRWTVLETSGLVARNSLGVQFLDAYTGYALADDLLYRSDDGGSHWSKVSDLQAGGPFFFLNRSDGWMVESRGTAGGPKGYPWHHYLRRTHDGGKTWSTTALDVGSGLVYFSRIVFFDDSTGFLLGMGNYGIGSYIGRTTDGGQTWQWYDSRDEPWGVKGIFASSFVDRQRGWLVTHSGGSSYILHTDDGGESWRPQYVQEPNPNWDEPMRYILNVHFVDASNGWATGGGGLILHTTDGGATWEDQSLPTEAGVTVTFLDAKTGWAAGSGTILFTDDGGATWQNCLSPALGPISLLGFVDIGHGFGLAGTQILHYLPGAPTGFFDVTESGTDPLSTAVYALGHAGIVQGYPDDTFRPTTPVLRAQLAKLLVGAVGLLPGDGAVDCPFWDVPPGPAADPLYPDDFVALAAREGIVEGFSPTTFKPFEPVSRIQMIKMLVRALQRFQPERLETPVAGWSSGWPEAGDAVHGELVVLADYNGLLSHWSPGDWDLWQPATRGEMALLLHVALGLDGPAGTK